jgi:hypothetical protein
MTDPEGPAITAEQAKQLEDLHLDFVRRQVALGNDGSVPDGRPEGSDWNQHAPLVQGNALAWDQYDAEARLILGLSPLDVEGKPLDAPVG